LKDDKLVKLIKNRPDEGLNKAIDIYAPLVKTIVARIIGFENKRDIEECISDVFVELWKSIDNFDNKKGILKNYLISVSRNVAINYYRRKLDKHELISIDENEIDLGFNLDNNLFDNLNKEIIQNTLNELGEPDRQIFIRRYYLYESVKEIANELKVNTKLVENKLFRGKAKLKEILVNKGINI